MDGTYCCDVCGNAAQLLLVFSGLGPHRGCNVFPSSRHRYIPRHQMMNANLEELIVSMWKLFRDGLAQACDENDRRCCDEETNT